MKTSIFLFLSFLVFWSCGTEKLEQEPGERVDTIQYHTGEENLSDKEISLATKVCNAFMTKKSFLDRVIINSNKELKFSIKIKRCEPEDANDENSDIEEISTMAKVIRGSSGHQFSSSESELMSDVITDEHSLIETICEEIANNESTGTKKLKKLSNTTYLYYEFFEAKSKYCDGDSTEPCFTVETLAKLDNNNNGYEVRDVNFFMVSLESSEAQTGMVSKRNFYTNQFCSKTNQTYYKKQSFLGYK